MLDNESDSILSHLIELRDRLLRCVLSFLIVFACLFPWARDIYSVLASPLLAALPSGGQMIATEVVSPFFVPVKVTIHKGKKVGFPANCDEYPTIFSRNVVCFLCGFPRRISFHNGHCA